MSTRYHAGLARRRAWQHAVKGRLGYTHLHNWLHDRRYGGFAGGYKGNAQWRDGMLGFSSVDYLQLPKIFNAANGLEIRPDDVLVDVGCGKGRVINWWLGLGLGNRIYGLELDTEIAEIARRRLAPWPSVSIVTGDAAEHLPADATVLFMFNPFWGHVMERFKERIIELYGEAAPLRIVYFMPMFEHVFSEDPRFVVEPARKRTVYRTVVIRLAGAVR
ncbi:MAG TPA: methyltransferase domain-containing protein [Thermoleophilaceae bacterium]|nr:methyltransferase domain-containing protein [Thermoleophilaceae bacterium]